MPGCLTFTATRVPSGSRARCTCPMDAVATGWRSIVASSSGGTTLAISSNGVGWDETWSTASSCFASSGSWVSR